MLGGIRLDGGDQPGVSRTGVEVYYNLVYNEREGLNLLNWDNGAFYNNTVYNSSLVGIHLHGTASRANTVRNNIVYAAGGNLVHNDSAEKSDIEYNLYFPDGASAFNWNGTTSGFTEWKMVSSQDENSPDPAEPRFVGADKADFHLQPTSPCVDAGADVGLTRDFDGTKLPVGAGFDIGAIESRP